MPDESESASVSAEQREVEAFLDDPASHQQVKHAWRPYLQAKLGFRNHWYPALFSHDLDGDTPKPVKVLGERVLLRRVDGRVYAVEDRCAHRRVPFSAKLECYTQETVTCWYHGFTFDPADDHAPECCQLFPRGKENTKEGFLWQISKILPLLLSQGSVGISRTLSNVGNCSSHCWGDLQQRQIRLPQQLIQ
ncbi:MAG: Rieske 2Fe-2S domain-containing protein [Candidatus Binatia bacterium]